MDNAAKALLIAGGILIGILIISLSMYLLTTFRNAYSSNMDILRSYQVDSFNSFFTRYGRSDGTSIITGDIAWNILAYVEEAQNDPYSIANNITSSGTLTTANYKQVLFFTDTCSQQYTFSFEYGTNGIVSNVVIN